MKKFIILFTLAIFFLYACEKQQLSDTNYSVFGFTNYEDAVMSLGEYADYGVYTDGFSKLSLQKITNSSDPYGEVVNLFSESPADPIIDGGVFKIGEIISEFDASSGQYRLVNRDNHSQNLGMHIMEMMGNEITFELQKGEKKIYSETIYVAKGLNDIDINNNEKIEFTNYYKVSRNNSKITWNDDTKNENGLVVLLIWSGDYYNSKSDEHTSQNIKMHFKAVLFKDTGSANLPKELFNKVPEGSIVTLYFIRGRVKILNLQKEPYSYKIEALSEVRKRILLTD